MKKFILKWQASDFELPVIGLDKYRVDGIMTYAFHIDPDFNDYDLYTNHLWITDSCDPEFWQMTEESIKYAQDY